MANLDVTMTMRLLDQTRSGASSAIRNLQSLGQKAQKIAADFSLAGGGVRAFGASVQGMIAAPITVAGNFEDSLYKIQAVAQATGAEIASIGDQARKLGRDSSVRFNAQELLGGYEFMSMAGFTIKQQLEAMPAVAALAQAGATDLAVTSDIASNIMGSFGIGAEEMMRVADAMTITFNKTNTSVTGLGDTLKYAGATAKDAGFSLEQALAATGMLGQAGIQGSMAGTGLRAVFSRLATVGQGRGAARTGGALKALGMDPKELQKQYNSGDFIGIMEAIGEGLAKNKISPAKRVRIFKALFGEEAATAGSLLATAAYEGIGGVTLRQMHGSIKAGQADNVTLETAKTMNKSNPAKIAKMRAQLMDAGIEIGEKMIPLFQEWLPVAKEMLDGFVAFAKENPNALRALTKAGLAIAALAPIVSTAAFGISGLATAVTLATGPFRLFTQVEVPKAARTISRLDAGGRRITQTLDATSDAAHTLGKATGPGSKLALSFLGKAGLVGMAGAAGFALGTLIDSATGFSDWYAEWRGGPAEGAFGRTQFRGVGATGNDLSLLNTGERQRMKEIEKELNAKATQLDETNALPWYRAGAKAAAAQVLEPQIEALKKERDALWSKGKGRGIQYGSGMTPEEIDALPGGRGLGAGGSGFNMEAEASEWERQNKLLQEISDTLKGNGLGQVVRVVVDNAGRVRAGIGTGPMSGGH